MKPLTKARRGALHVLAGGPARYSNETIVARERASVIRRVDWQAADWLVAESYASRTGETITITEAGRARLRAETTGATR